MNIAEIVQSIGADTAKLRKVLGRAVASGRVFRYNPLHHKKGVDGAIVFTQRMAFFMPEQLLGGNAIRLDTLQDGKQVATYPDEFDKLEKAYQKTKGEPIADLVPAPIDSDGDGIRLIQPLGAKSTFYRFHVEDGEQNEAVMVSSSDFDLLGDLYEPAGEASTAVLYSGPSDVGRVFVVLLNQGLPVAMVEAVRSKEDMVQGELDLDGDDQAETLPAENRTATRKIKADEQSGKVADLTDARTKKATKKAKPKKGSV